MAFSPAKFSVKATPSLAAPVPRVILDKDALLPAIEEIM